MAEFAPIPKASDNAADGRECGSLPQRPEGVCKVLQHEQLQSTEPASPWSSYLIQMAGPEGGSSGQRCPILGRGPIAAEPAGKLIRGLQI